MWRVKRERAPIAVNRLDCAALCEHLIAEKHLIAYVQKQSFGPVMEKLSENSPDCFEEIIKKLSLKTGKKKYLKDLLTLRCLRPRLRPDGILCVEGRLKAADLPTDEKNPLILPFKHAFTRLLILDCHENSAHGGIQYTVNPRFNGTRFNGLRI